MEDNKEEEEVPDVDLNGANGINPHDEEAYEELNEEKIKAQISQKTRHGVSVLMSRVVVVTPLAGA